MFTQPVEMYNNNVCPNLINMQMYVTGSEKNF